MRTSFSTAEWLPPPEDSCFDQDFIDLLSSSADKLSIMVQKTTEGHFEI